MYTIHSIDGLLLNHYDTADFVASYSDGQIEGLHRARSPVTNNRRFNPSRDKKSHTSGGT